GAAVRARLQPARPRPLHPRAHRRAGLRRHRAAVRRPARRGGHRVAAGGVRARRHRRHRPAVHRHQRRRARARGRCVPGLITRGGNGAMLIVEQGEHPAPDEPGGRPPLRPPDRRGVAFDLVAVLAALVLVGLGLANLLAVDGIEQATRQGTIAAAGVVLLVALWRFRERLLVVLGWITYVVAVLLLAAVHVAGVTVNGATRWITIGGITFQPSELVKLGLLLVLAAVLGSGRPAWQRFAAAVALAAVPLAFTALQPDLST